MELVDSKNKAKDKKNKKKMESNLIFFYFISMQEEKVLQELMEW